MANIRRVDERNKANRKKRGGGGWEEERRITNAR
jgi:hypothetical protein